MLTRASAFKLVLLSQIGEVETAFFFQGSHPDSLVRSPGPRQTNTCAWGSDSGSSRRARGIQGVILCLASSNSPRNLWACLACLVLPVFHVGSSFLQLQLFLKTQLIHARRKRAFWAISYTYSRSSSPAYVLMKQEVSWAHG